MLLLLLPPPRLYPSVLRGGKGGGAEMESNKEGETRREREGERERERGQMTRSHTGGLRLSRIRRRRERRDDRRSVERQPRGLRMNKITERAVQIWIW